MVFITAFFKLNAQNDFRMSLLYDVKMKAVGPYETSETGEWDLLFRFAYRHKHWEYQFFLENFYAIKYGAIGFGAHYLYFIEDANKNFYRWEFAAGPGIGIIVREELGVEEPFFELNGDIRYFFNRSIGISVLGNLKYRTDLVERYDEEDPWRLSGFLGLVYRW